MWKETGAGVGQGSVVITAEAVSVTSRLHYLVSFVAVFAALLIE